MAKVNDKRLAFVGPTDPEFGFPLWYEDGAGVRLDLGLRPDPMTPAVGDLPSPGAPVKLPENYPDEAFYYLAESRMPAGGAGTVGRARLVLALEAAFGGAGLPIRTVASCSAASGCASTTWSRGRPTSSPTRTA